MGPMADETPALPAATVILVRDGPDGLETLMLRKNDEVAFGGMWVFPGGRVDEADRDPDRPDDEEAAARRAAVREAAEEAGLAVAPESLVPFAHWTPPAMGAPRRYATWFFLAPAPDGAVEIDGGEIHDHVWARPADVLARHAAGEVQLVPPTWVTLDRLSSCPTVAAALAEARRRPVERFVTRMVRVDGGMVAMWAGDAGYERGDPDAPGPRHRLWMVPGAWRYERTV